MCGIVLLFLLYFFCSDISTVVLASIKKLSKIVFISLVIEKSKNVSEGPQNPSVRNALISDKLLRMVRVKFCQEVEA